jgi:hypothetical protein
MAALNTLETNGSILFSYGTDNPVYQYVASSSDDGSTWGKQQLRAANLAVAGDLSYFSAAPSNPSKVFFMSGRNSQVEIYLTENSGADWQTLVRITGTVWPTDEFSIANIYVSKAETLYYVGTDDRNYGFLGRGKLTANSESFGPMVLAPSVGYVQEQLMTSSIRFPSTITKFKLMNVSEFPHSAGVFQMPNMIIGTTDSGKIGNSESDIIQVSYFGSVVHLMWPDQRSSNTSTKGFGSLSAGQKSGKLTTNWATGSFFDVTEFDHLALYGYINNVISGTIDKVDIRVERRPLRDAPFAVDQAVEYNTSGSEVVAEYRDLIHSKEVDYGDLSIREIGWPIDIPLTNVKEVRISARHRTGQSDDKNKNFIVWGRLIRSEEET